MAHKIAFAHTGNATWIHVNTTAMVAAGKVIKKEEKISMDMLVRTPTKC